MDEGVKRIKTEAFGCYEKFCDEINKVENNVLEEAIRVVYGSRQDDYGSATENFENICKLWKPVLGIDVTPQQVVLCMIQTKIARQMFKNKRDNMVDIAGYSAVLEKLNKGL